MPWGGKDCSINLNNIPEIALNNSCCDLRTENCGLIEGYANGLQTDIPIYAKIIIEEVYLIIFKSLL